MITRLEYTSRNMERRAIIERNDSGEAAQPWDVELLYLDRACVAVQHVETLTRAQAIARTWVNHR